MNYKKMWEEMKYTYSELIDKDSGLKKHQLAYQIVNAMEGFEAAEKNRIESIQNTNEETENLNLSNLEQMVSLKNIINKALSTFPKSFINKENEIYLLSKYTGYFSLDDVKTELMFKCKMLEFLSGPITSHNSPRISKRHLKFFNEVMGSDFSMLEMDKIYTRLGQSRNRPLTIKFIQLGYDMELINNKVYS